ncbi:DUF6733 family protein [Spirosoma montaniterrae]|uniref:Uncharacterized protein n=1 Tax=Spirosoma montaniterrae TaxID=1178516 RepID=A0A1P9WX48_9BACT|nr:DUF6733 family protein [Spirosoma montaniterrae]AQG79930.1 hypothetical protein AWR27_11705 [Spirosoma montaniterrae]
MKKFNYLPLVFFVVVSLSAQAQTPRKSNYSISLNQDSFFGFYPTINGSLQLNSKTDWTFYGIFWTTPSFGTGGGGGLWTEVGTGINVNTLNGALKINPQIGFTNGKLLSNGAFPMFAEGLVPSLTANLNTKRLEGQYYLGYYAAIRKGQIPSPDQSQRLINAPSQNNFLHWWVNAGYKVSSVVSLGAHYEHLRSNPSVGNSSNVYKWAGPYVQAALPNGLTLRFTGGSNVLDRPATDGNNSFYKMTASFGF